MRTSKSLTEHGNSLLIKAAMEEVIPFSNEDPMYPEYERKLHTFFSNYLPQEIVNKFIIYCYQKDSWIIHEDYDNTKRFLYYVIDGKAKCTYNQRFLAYKVPGQLLGTIGLVRDQKRPSGTITAYTDTFVAARLDVTEKDIRDELYTYANFMGLIANDLAETVVENNALSILSSSNASMLSAYILLNTDGGEAFWLPSSMKEVQEELSICDHSHLNKVLKSLIAKGGLTPIDDETTNRRQKKYQVHADVLKCELQSVDYRLLSHKFGFVNQ